MPLQLMIVGMQGEGGEINALKGMSDKRNQGCFTSNTLEVQGHNEKDVKAVKCLSPRSEPSNPGVKGIISE